MFCLFSQTFYSVFTWSECLHLASSVQDHEVEEGDCDHAADGEGVEEGHGHAETGQ